MDFLTRVITSLFDVAVLPFGGHRTAALVVLSLVSGAALALLFRAVSRPERIKRARDLFQARILEMRLYPDDAVLLTRAFLGALATQGNYLRAAGKPILILLVVAVPVFIQLEARFARRPLTGNERALVTARLKPGLDTHAVPTSLQGSAAIAVDPRALRVPASREIVWRVETKAHENDELVARSYDVDYRFELRAHASARVVTPERSTGFMDAFVHPGVPPLPANSAFESIRVAYPDAHYTILGKRMGWLTVFLVGSLVGALLPTWLLKIQM